MDNGLKVGEIAVRKNLLTTDELNEILLYQKKIRDDGTSIKKSFLGQLLVKQGICSEEMLHDILGCQQNTFEKKFTNLQIYNEQFEFGSYIVLELIDQGGMGAVYKAKDKDGNTVALKTVKWHNLGRSVVKRFHREIEILRQLEHKNIVPVYDYGKIGGIPYFAMKYIEGKSLNHLIKSNKSSSREIIKKFLPLLNAIYQIHKKGIIHRDLKPSNILLDENDNFILIDFGIGKIISQDTLTTKGILATPFYIAPETIKSAIKDPNNSKITKKMIKQDERTDIWSLGVILYQLISGQLPFYAQKTDRLYEAICHLDPPPLTQFFKNGSSQWKAEEVSKLEAICYCALQKNQKDRYKNAQLLHNDLENFLNNKPIKAKIYRPIFIYNKFHYIMRYISSFFFFSLSIYLFLQSNSYSSNFFVILCLLVSIFLLCTAYKRQNYLFCIDEDRALERVWFKTKKLLRWDEISDLFVENNKIQIITSNKIWKSPELNHISPKLQESIYKKVKNIKQEKQIVMMLSEGKDIEFIAKNLNMTINMAKPLVKTIAKKMINKFSNFLLID